MLRLQKYYGLLDFYPNPFLMIMINASCNDHYSGRIKGTKDLLFFSNHMNCAKHCGQD